MICKYFFLLWLPFHSICDVFEGTLNFDGLIYHLSIYHTWVMDLCLSQGYKVFQFFLLEVLWISVQFSHSVMSNSLWPHEPQHARPPSHQLLEFTQTYVHRVGDAIQPSHSLSSLLLLPPIPPSIRVFSNESTLHMRWPKYWSFSFSVIPYNEHPGLISFRMDWLDLLAVQGTLKSLLQHHSSKTSILRCSAFL